MFLKLNRPKGPYNILKLELRYTTSRQLEVIWQNMVFHKQENVVVISNSRKTHFSTNDRSSQLCSYRHLLMFIEQLWSTQHYFVNVRNKKQDYYTYGKVSTNFGTQQYGRFKHQNCWSNTPTQRRSLDELFGGTKLLGIMFIHVNISPLFS